MNQREVRWERMFRDELEAAMEECPVAYLAYGLCEPHGPQNALGMDALRAYGALCQTAHQIGGIVAPPEYWHCHEMGGSAPWAHERIGQVRPWLTAVPPWIFLKNLCYHIRAIDALGFHAAILFSGHSGPHRQDVPVVLDILQAHISTRLYFTIGSGTRQSRFADDKGMGGHAGRGETSLLWATDPDCVDLSRLPAPDEPGSHFALGDLAEASDRRAGERMVQDIVDHLVVKARELLDEYARLKPNPTPLTFGQIEQIWNEEIQPQMKDFVSMQDGPNGPPENSRWYPNWRVPDLE